MADKRLDNLMPIEEVNARRTPEERREAGRKAGLASGASRRRKKTAKQQMEQLLSMPVTRTSDKKAVKSVGLDPEDADNMTLLAVSTYMKALSGDPKATELAVNGFGMSEAERERIKLQKEQLKLQRAEMEQKSREQELLSTREYHGIPSLAIIPKYAEVLRDIVNHDHDEYVFKGGRGSTKSSFISLCIVHLIKTNPTFNACVFRQVGNTISGSVYNQLIWAINELGLNSEFKCTKSPAEITLTATGQKIFFRGADDPAKVKSIKPTSGYLAVVWFEELDQFFGDAAIRKIEQSVIRGGDVAYKFKSFNPPKSTRNWVNKYVRQEKPGMRVIHNTYTDVPKEFLGQQFIADAEFLKATNEKAYKNEYLGLETGDGGNVFENVTLRSITDEEIAQFDHIYEGTDWGFYPDPLAFTRMHYDAARMRLYIFGEMKLQKTGNEEAARLIREKFDVKDPKTGQLVSSVDDAIIYCDSAEPKSVADWKAVGMPAKAVVKGPGSVDYTMKWLARLVEIVIDPDRCPNTADEFIEYEYERDKNDEIISAYPDKDNHFIDSTRYAMYPVWKHKGQ